MLKNLLSHVITPELIAQVKKNGPALAKELGDKAQLRGRNLLCRLNEAAQINVPPPDENVHWLHRVTLNTGHGDLTPVLGENKTVEVWARSMSHEYSRVVLRAVDGSIVNSFAEGEVKQIDHSALWRRPDSTAIWVA